MARTTVLIVYRKGELHNEEVVPHALQKIVRIMKETCMLKGTHGLTLVCGAHTVMLLLFVTATQSGVVTKHATGGECTRRSGPCT